jgi:SAM-dependent methyltransferase
MTAPESSTGRQAHNEQQISYFTGRDLPRMDPIRRADTLYTQRHLDAVVAAAAIRPGERVIDVGSGPGKYTVGLAARGFDVTGMDLTPALVEQLRDVAPAVTAVEGDLLDPPPELHGAFDVVAGFFVLHHLSDLDAAFAGTLRLTRPGGRVVFIEPNAYFPGFYVQVTLTPGMSWKGDKGIVHTCGPGSCAAPRRPLGCTTSRSPRSARSRRHWPTGRGADGSRPASNESRGGTAARPSWW